MSSRDPFGIDPEDLGVRARRGLSNKKEQRELERATEASASLRIAYEVGRDLDAVTAVRGGDDALIANAAAAALARAEMKPTALARAEMKPASQATARARRRIGAAAAGLFVLAASGAAAALWSGAVEWRLPFPRATEAAPRATPAPHAARARKITTRAAESAPAPVFAPVRPASESAPVAAPPEPTQSARGKHKSAAELFHAANAARRDGAIARAMQLYAELRSAYPDSDESELARVSLGQLLLARGDAQGAEREFRRYLARGRGQLMEEALLGRAQSLERLGRAREERESLTRLVSEYPESVYAARARARLLALE